MIFRRWFWRGKVEQWDSLAPQGERIYAIGDVHGRFDLLEDMLGQLEKDCRDADADVIRLILLGDLIDRGPASQAVVERAMQASGQFRPFHWLTGNHEEMLLAALDGNIPALRQFIRAGGQACLISYGLDPVEYQRASLEQLSLALPDLIPPAHQQFLRRGEDLIIRGDYVFAHAGIRPGLPIQRQRQQDLRWIRNDFLSAGHFEGLTIVHGHTISPNPVNLHHRIGIDTGAFQTGRLSAVALEGNRRWFLEARA
ncbi:metallophosphoesterase [Sphingobium chungbukense]|uniref:Calcineurin-like phosphoesterase domain-containing protein n=1 Tax=Sphingobium chungbukense TaxID=56193 RepID=A0A0M3AL11_9SPHN|nr:metallophosphoesterase [Sphingobium chungbukense]KKW90787.1 hypothetical protein YP76_18245 [Sphingobium chungbukense]